MRELPRSESWRDADGDRCEPCGDDGNARFGDTFRLALSALEPDPELPIRTEPDLGASDGRLFEDAVGMTGDDLARG